MSTIWDPHTYNAERRRLVPCFDEFYGTVVELVERFCPMPPRVLDLGAGTGILSSAIAEHLQNARLCLVDVSAEMLARASTSLAAFGPEVIIQPLTAALPKGPFDAVVSALAIHHLGDEEKRGLYAGILQVLRPGGIFINAEQVAGSSHRLQELFEQTHLARARNLGSSAQEIQGALERMRHDRCSSLAEQLDWLAHAGFEDVECFLRWFRFAVFGGWRPDSSPG